MSLFDTLKNIFTASRLTQEAKAINTNGEPPSLAQTLTVTRLAGILRQAEAGDCMELFGLYREMRLGSAHLQAVTNQRLLAVLTKTLNILPADPANPSDIFAAQACAALTKSAGWQAVAMQHLMKGHLYPVAVLQQVYRAAGRNDLGLRYVPAQWVPVPFHLLDFQDGVLKIWDASVDGYRAQERRLPTPIRHVIHRGHLLADIPDNWGGPLRAALFWWLFATQDRDWWVRFLNRFGSPFITGKHDTGDTKGRAVLTRAFSAATQLFGLVVSKDTDVQVHSIATNSHGEAFEKMHTFANSELSKLILGQSMTVSAQAGGLGGAQAEVQSNTLGDIEAWDLSALAATVNTQIIEPFLRINGLSGNAVMQLATDTGKELKAKTDFLEAAAKIGLEPTDEAVKALSQAGGIQLQRASRPVIPGFTALSAEAPESRADAILRRSGQPSNEQLDLIAARAAPDLGAAFTGRFSPVMAMLQESTSADDLEARLTAHFKALPPARLTALIEDALVAYSATGAASHRPRPKR